MRNARKQQAIRLAKTIGVSAFSISIGAYAAKMHVGLDFIIEHMTFFRALWIPLCFLVGWCLHERIEWIIDGDK